VSWNDISLLNITIKYRSPAEVQDLSADFASGDFSVEAGHLVYTTSFKAIPFTGVFDESTTTGGSLECSPHFSQNWCKEACAPRFQNPDRNAADWIGYAHGSNFCECRKQEDGTYKDPSDWMAGKNWFDLTTYEKGRRTYCIRDDAYGCDILETHWSIYPQGRIACHCQKSFDQFGSQNNFNESAVDSWIADVFRGDAAATDRINCEYANGTCDRSADWVLLQAGLISDGGDINNFPSQNTYAKHCGCRTSDSSTHPTTTSFGFACNLTSMDGTTPPLCPNNMDLTDPANPIYYLKDEAPGTSYSINEGLLVDDAKICACLRDYNLHVASNLRYGTGTERYQLIDFDTRVRMPGDYTPPAGNLIGTNPPAPALASFGASGVQTVNLRVRSPAGQVNTIAADCGAAVLTRTFGISGCVTSNGNDYSAYPSLNTNAHRYYFNNSCTSIPELPNNSANTEIRIVRERVCSEMTPADRAAFPGCQSGASGGGGGGTGGSGTGGGGQNEH
jgi:hypothetical protein